MSFFLQGSVKDNIFFRMIRISCRLTQQLGLSTRTGCRVALYSAPSGGVTADYSAFHPRRWTEEWICGVCFNTKVDTGKIKLPLRIACLVRENVSHGTQHGIVRIVCTRHSLVPAPAQQCPLVAAVVNTWITVVSPQSHVTTLKDWLNSSLPSSIRVLGADQRQWRLVSGTQTRVTDLHNCRFICHVAPSVELVPATPPGGASYGL